jgi:hypothetical protein
MDLTLLTPSGAFGSRMPSPAQAPAGSSLPSNKFGASSNGDQPADSGPQLLAAQVPSNLAAKGQNTISLPIEQWSNMQQKLKEMEQRQKELLAALTLVKDQSNKTISALQVSAVIESLFYSPPACSDVFAMLLFYFFDFR